MKSILTKLGISIAALLILAACTAGPAGPSDPNEVTAEDNVKGLQGSAVTLIEYGDFQCPACSFVAPMVNQAAVEFGDRVQFVYRHFPLTGIHPNAIPAAQAAQAAANQGKFWEMHDMLYIRQNLWSKEVNVESIFADFAKELELDVDKFREDYDSRETLDRVRRDANLSARLGLNSTPTLILNGEKIQNPRSYEQLKAILEGALRDAKPAEEPVSIGMPVPGADDVVETVVEETTQETPAE